jgi:autotransporter-associated beta strand protein
MKLSFPCVTIIRHSLAIMAAACLSLAPAQAQTKTWTGNHNGGNGGGSNNRWSRGDNWAGGVAPSSGDALVFSGTKRLTSNDNNLSNFTFNGITFDSSAGAFTLSGNSITLSGNLTNNSTNTQTVSLAMALSGVRTFNALAGDLAVGGVMSGAGGVTKSGANTLTLTANNTYTGATTIAAGTLQLGSGDTSGALSTSSSIANNGTLAFNRSNTMTQGTDFASVIAGSGGITKLGSNTLVFNGANTYTGATVVNAGTLRAGAAAGGRAFGNLSAMTIASGAVLDLNGFSQTIGSLAGNGDVALGSGNATLTIGGDNTSTVFGGVVSGSGSLAKVGTGTFAVTNTVVPEGFTISVSGGTFQLGNGGAGGALRSPSTVINNATYAWNRSDDREQGATSVITGAGEFLKLGDGQYTLSGTNSYAGGTRIEAGTLRVNNTSSIGSTTGTLTVNSGSLDLANYSIAVGNLTGTGGTITSSVGGSRTLTIGTGDTGGGIFGGVIADGAGTTSLTKVGTGTITLTGTNTYSGATTVSAGTLRLEGSGSINSSFPIIVAPGATLVKNSGDPLDIAPVLNGTGPNSRAFLRGNGRINAAMTLDSIYSVLAPGNSPGSLTFGESQSWASYTYQWEVNDWVSSTPATNFDVINISGGLNLTGNATNSYVLNVLSLTAANVTGDVQNFAETNNAWTILTTTSGITGFSADYWTISAAGFTNTELGTWSLSLANSNRDLVLTYTAVPEPPMLVLLAAAGVGFAVIRRRRSLARG